MGVLFYPSLEVPLRQEDGWMMSLEKGNWVILRYQAVSCLDGRSDDLEYLNVSCCDMQNRWALSKDYIEICKGFVFLHGEMSLAVEPFRKSVN